MRDKPTFACSTAERFIESFAGCPLGRASATRLIHQALLKQRPSRWPIWGSWRSETLGTVRRDPSIGRKRSNHSTKAEGGKIRRIRSASLRHGDKKSAPLGSSHAGYSR